MPAALRNPALWYPANAYAGSLLLAAGIILAIAALGFPLVPGMTETVAAISWTIMRVSSLGAVVALSVIYVRSLTG